ncbi:hypothetical protein B296_00022106 [Ensete ventricosum]|uniref:Uncharacterized protein n=1 Tax=Ensete ventricosum TaxID=4639 RepID=A0A426XTS8_ENSVE|nr:hypothetical protein B296_00022106 [Ensete ventricosum]
MYTAVVEEGSSGMERETTAVVFNLLLAAIKILFAARITVGRNQGGWQQEVVVGSVGQRKMHAAVEGTREIGWLKGWWTEGFGFWVQFVAVLGAIWGFGFVEFRFRAVIAVDEG